MKTHASLCSGVGMFDLVAELCGLENVFQVENNSFCQRILAQHFPNAARYKDIRQFDARPFAGLVDVISAGEPCQPNSGAGKRLGAKDPRFLWPEVLRIIDEASPLCLLNENVPGSISNGILDRKISELEAIGYACWPALVIPAGAIADHRRNRVWLVAYANSERRQKRNAPTIPETQKEGTVPNRPFLPPQCWDAYRYATLSEILREANGNAEGMAPAERNAAIHAAGNAIHPGIAVQIFQAIKTIK